MAIPRARRVSMGAMVGWVVLGLVVVSMVGAVLQRKKLVAEYPAIRPVFAAFGLADQATDGNGLVFADLVSARGSVDGTVVLSVEGRIVNESGDSRDVPPMRGSLRDASDHEVQTWTFEVPTRKLERGESTRFKTELRNPQPAGTGVEITFVPR